MNRTPTPGELTKMAWGRGPREELIIFTDGGCFSRGLTPRVLVPEPGGYVVLDHARSLSCDCAAPLDNLTRVINISY